MFFYQRKRKLDRVSLIAWGLLVLAMGLSGLLACWIATRSKKEQPSSALEEAPQHLLIAE